MCFAPALAPELGLAAAAGQDLPRNSAAGRSQDPPRVVALELRSDVELDPSIRPVDLFAVRLGEPLDPDAVRRTLSNAHAAARFAAVEFYTRPAVDDPAGGVVAVLALDGPLRLESTRIEGSGLGRLAWGVAPRSTRRALRRSLARQVGSFATPSTLATLETDLVELLRGEGYFEARVEPRPVPLDAATSLYELVVRVDAGRRAEIAAVTFEGDLGAFSSSELAEQIGSRPGRPYERQRARDDAEDLERFLRRRGHAAARVDEPLERYDYASGRLELVFPLAAGPSLVLELDGLERRTLKRRDLSPFASDSRFDPERFDAVCTRIRRDLETRGFGEARVDCAYGPALPDLPSDHAARVLRVTVEPGRRQVVEEIRFVDDPGPGADSLRGLLQTSKRKRLGSRGRLDPERLDDDLEALRSVYQLDGWLDVEVGPVRRVELPSDDPEIRPLRLEIPIDRGERRQVVRLTLEGVVALDADRVIQSLPVRPGGPYHPLLVSDAVATVRTLYEEAGYPAARVDARLSWGPRDRLVDIALAVEEGPQRRIDRVVLRGHHRTRASLVREIADLEPGEIFSRRRLLAAERDLYRLGIFSRVDVRPAPSLSLSRRSRFESDEIEPPIELRDILIEVEEGRRWRLSYGVSYQSDDGIGGLFGITRSNLMGRAGRLQLDVRGSANDQRLRLLYDQPTLGPVPVPTTVALFARAESRESFDLEETGTQLAFRYEDGRDRLSVSFDYRLIELSEETVDPTSLEPEDREVEIASITPAVFIDRRDDPIDPTRGWSSAYQAELAVPTLGAETHFVKLFWQQTAYRDLGGFGHLAASLRLGAIEPLDEAPLGDPIVPLDLASAAVPISERFFGGGRTTHRAYSRDQLGILGETLIETPDGRLLEAGGNALVLANLDWRFPIRGSLGGVAFFDTGNLWADWEDVDLGQIRPGVGLGLRYSSPIGPLRFEIGWKVDAEDFEDDAPVYFFSFGNPF